MPTAFPRVPFRRESPCAAVSANAIFPFRIQSEKQVSAVMSGLGSCDAYASM